MRSITIITPHYFPETGPAAKRATDIARYLLSNGWDVRVVTLLPHYPQNRIYPGYEGQASLERLESGVRVLRLQPWIVPRSDLFLRLISEAFFCVRAAARFASNPTEIVFATTPYIFTGPFAYLGARCTGKLFVLEIRDLFWLYARAAGRKTFMMDLLFDKLTKWTARRASLLVTTTAAQAEHFHHVNPRARVVPNGVPEDIFSSFLRLREPFSSRPNSPVVGYVGLLGYAQGLDVIVDTAAKVEEADFVFVGDGPEKERLEQITYDRRIQNVRFLGSRSGEELIEQYGNIDVLVAHLRANPAFETAEPSKLWEYMATGRPVIFGGEGPTARLLEDRGIGLVVRPEDPEAMASAIRQYLADRSLAVSIGSRGREFVLAERNRTKILDGLEQELSRLVEI